MKKHTLLHENCEGLIQTFREKNYGLCQECGNEGYFKIVKKEDDIEYVEFEQITIVRK